MNTRRTDTIIAAGSLLAIMPATYANLSWTGPGERPLDPAGVALILITTLSLAFRRTAPLAAGIVAAAGGVVYYAAHYPGVFVAAPALASIYTLAMLGRRMDAIWLAIGLAVPVYGLMALSAEDPAAGNWMMLLSGWLVAMVVIGEVTRNRRAYLREVEQRATAEAQRAEAMAQRAEALAERAEAVEQRAREAERTREEAALRRAGEERLWIAQELHDSLTHSISVVNVQAALAMELLERRPERIGEALAAIKESGHEAMHELRATLGVLRQSEPEGAETGLSGLPRLVSRAEGAGLRVTHSVSGDPYALPPDVDRAAYRIAQEALTNVLRHAGAAAVTVAVEYDPSRVVLRVENDGEPGTAGPGMGLIGMRERAVAVGGLLAAGPGEHGGFAVRAELPAGVAA